MSLRFARLISLTAFVVMAPWLAQMPLYAAPALPDGSVEDRDDLVLFVEPIGTEWLERLLPPLMENLIRVAPYRVTWSSSEDALRSVGSSTRQLALMRRSSVMDFGDRESIEWLELGPASCVAFVVRQDSPWSSYGDLNYAPRGRLRVDLVSPGARRHFEALEERFPLATELDIRIRPSLIAVQRLVAKDIDVVMMELPRRDDPAGSSTTLQDLRNRGLRLLDLPDILVRQSERLIPGEVLVAQAWPWGEPTTYRTLCDPFVLTMPAANADRLVYALHQVLARDGETMPPLSPVPMSASGLPHESESVSVEQRNPAAPKLDEAGLGLSAPSVARPLPLPVETSASTTEGAPSTDSSKAEQADSESCDPAAPYVFTDVQSGTRIELTRCVGTRDQPRLLAVPKLTNDLVRMVQRHLNDLGFNSGAVDGVIGRRTRGAIRRFQLAQGLAPSRLVSFELLDRLGPMHAVTMRSTRPVE